MMVMVVLRAMVRAVARTITLGWAAQALAADLPPAVPLTAIDGRVLARASNCMSCHALDRKMIGPSFKAVADRYRGDASAQAILARKLQSGGKGVWGAAAMPGNQRLSEQQRQDLVRWVLAHD